MVTSPAVPPRSRVPDAARLLELIDGFAEQPILVLGDLVADRFIRGTPKRISREAPVLILRHDGEELVPGGGGNAVANLHALGGRPLPVGFVGDDEPGRALLDLFASRGIPIDGILVRRGYRTACKTRVLAGARHAIKQQIVRFDVEDPLALTDAERADLERRLIQRSTRCRVFVLSDYGLGAGDPRFATALGARDGLVRIADSRYRLGELAGLDGATPNEEELESLEGEEGPILERGERLRKRLRVRFLLLTRGGHGMILFHDGEAVSIPVHGTDQVADVTGAGDTVLGTFALAVAAGAEPLEAALLANYAGGIVVMKMGTATLDSDELRAAVRADPKPLSELRWESC
jgi:D-glycero-beta-D-manno-heptose-7-phosphate kinase